MSDKIKGPLKIRVEVDGAHSMESVAQLLVSINAAVERHLDVPSDGYHVSIDDIRGL